MRQRWKTSEVREQRLWILSIGCGLSCAEHRARKPLQKLLSTLCRLSCTKRTPRSRRANRPLKKPLQRTRNGLRTQLHQTSISWAIFPLFTSSKTALNESTSRLRFLCVLLASCLVFTTTQLPGAVPFFLCCVVFCFFFIFWPACSCVRFLTTCVGLCCE